MLISFYTNSMYFVRKIADAECTIIKGGVVVELLILGRAQILMWRLVSPKIFFYSIRIL